MQRLWEATEKKIILSIPGDTYFLLLPFDTIFINKGLHLVAKDTKKTLFLYHSENNLDLVPGL